MKLDLKLENSEEIRDALAFVRGVLSPRATLKGATALLFNNLQARFLAEIDPDGAPWEKSTLSVKEGRGTLFRTGDLFDSLYSRYMSDFEWDIGYNRDGNVPYGRYFQEGIGQDQRRFIGVSEGDMRDILEYLEERIADGIKRGWNHRG